MNIQELKKMMSHVPDHKPRHDTPMNKPMSKAKALYKAREGGKEWKLKLMNQNHRINQSKQ